MSSAEPIAVAILAKAPIPGLVKTRLIPTLGPEGAAALQARLIARTLATACAAATGPVALWARPEESHFLEFAQKFPIGLARQSDGDLGARMLAALQSSCPALSRATRSDIASLSSIFAASRGARCAPSGLFKTIPTPRNIAALRVRFPKIIR